MSRLTSTCDGCGKSFEHYASVKRRFCSMACRNQVQSQEMRDGSRGKPEKPKRGETNPCEVCGTPVYRNKSQATKGEGRYCSNECRNIAQTKKPVVKSCAYCGKEMRLKPSQAARQHCSKECEMRAKTKRPLDRLHNGKPARKDKQGYVMVYEPEHPNKSFHGWQYEHRLVVEEALGRYLGSDEHVHHVNGIKDDNRIENLEVMNGSDHAILSGIEYRDWLRRQLAELEAYRQRYGPIKEE